MLELRKGDAMKTLLGLACGLLLAAVSAPPAFAHSHVFFGFNVGVPLFPPAYYYPPPAYYYPQPVVAPPAYIEQAQQPAPQPENWWYYCADSKTYYPYVKECRSGWQRVAPQPPRS
jgi:hypothetical protein